MFGYAPIISHGGIDGSAPFVLSDGHKVAFVSMYDVRDTLLRWREIEGKKIELVYYDSAGYDYNVNFELYNPDHFRGVRATRFIDLRFVREQKCNLAPNYDIVFERKLNIVSGNGRRWLHLHIDGFFDTMWDENPRQVIGEIVAGWIGVGDGLYWRRGRNRVEAFIEVSRASLNGGKYVVESETSQFIDYEQNFSVLEWFSKEIKNWKEHFVTQITKKARLDYVYARQRSGIDIRQLMASNLDAKICVQDSLDCGNCRPATEDFIKQYGIQVEDGCCLIRDLLENSSIDEMLRNFAFQKVVHYKLLVSA